MVLFGATPRYCLVRRKGSGLIAKKIFRRKKVVEGVNGNMHVAISENSSGSSSLLVVIPIWKELLSF